MAKLKNLLTQKAIHLSKRHVFGRQKQSVNTYLEGDYISRIHANVYWNEQQWFLKNTSTNGIIINNEKLHDGQQLPLNLNDKIIFDIKKRTEYQITDLSPPQDTLTALDNKGCEKKGLPNTIVLGPIHFLPNDNDPELIVTYSSRTKTWAQESTLLNDNGVEHTLEDGDIVYFSGIAWLFETGTNNSLNTQKLCDPDAYSTLQFIFRISQDEELTELKVKLEDDIIDLDVRSHHYLTALLARYKRQENKTPIDESLRGWIPIKKLSKDLGLSESHINIQIHRARKQIADQLPQNNLSATHFIERRRGYARFGYDNFTIFKGDRLEM